MPSNANVFLHYGPYRACGFVEHRETRLTGLQTVLKNAGHHVELIKSPDWNVVKLWVNGEMVYQCDINDLDYDGDGDLDLLCHDAARAVWRAY